MHLTPTVAALILGALSEVSLASSHKCCAALRDSPVKDQVVYPNSDAYKESVGSYWATNVQLEPDCIVQPLTAEDVAVSVTRLVAADRGTCKFAVRSGGHTVWAGANNIEDGVTIDLSMMNSTTYNKEEGTASILPGSRWQAVYKTLAEYNVTVPGGRAADVGVAGFLIGGGNTFHTARVGFACDNVVNYEVVLADGNIINVNKNAYPDLFKALKGGTANFGVVTKYDLQIIDDDKMWGGIVTYDNATTAQQIEAGHHFINNLSKDPYASWIGQWQYLSVSDQNMVANALEYSKPVPFPAAFDNFTKITNTSSSMRTANIWNLTQELGQAAGYRDVFVTGTFVNNLDVLKRTVEVHNRVIEEAKAGAESDDFTLFTMIQPFPRLFTEHSIAKGGNVLGLDRFEENLFQVLFDYSWKNEADDTLFHTLATGALEELDTYAKSLGADNEFIYLNYADKTQDPLSGYGSANVEFIRAVAEKYDASGVFQHQAPGGFKISAVGL